MVNNNFYCCVILVRLIAGFKHFILYTYFICYIYCTHFNIKLNEVNSELF